MSSRRIFGVRASIVRLAAALLFALSPGDAQASPADLDALLFANIDAGTATFLTGGAKIGAGSLAREGFVGIASAGIGRRLDRFPCGCGAKRTLLHSSANLSLEVGYQWFGEGTVVALFAGPEEALDRLTNGRGSSVGSAVMGVRLHAEAWIRPTDDTLVQASAIVGTSRDSAWARVAWGYRLWGAYVGPEGSVYAETAGYKKGGVGLHATEITFAPVSLRLSAGAQWEPWGGKPSPYVSLVAWAPW